MTVDELNRVISIVGAASLVERDHATELTLLRKSFPKFEFGTKYLKKIGHVIVAKPKKKKKGFVAAG